MNLGRALLKGLKYVDAKSVWGLYDELPLYKRLWKVFYYSDLYDTLTEPYNIVRRFCENVYKVYTYLPLIWQHKHWDHGYVLRFQKRLYENLYKGIYDEGHHVYTPKEARKLKLVIALLGRLEADEYDENYEGYLNRRYGPNEYYFPQRTDPKSGRVYSTLASTRQDRMTEKEQAEYIKVKQDLYKLGEYRKKQDFELLGKLIARNSNKWWD